jgi:hypothetical protein
VFGSCGDAQRVARAVLARFLNATSAQAGALDHPETLKSRTLASRPPGSQDARARGVRGVRGGGARASTARHRLQDIDVVVMPVSTRVAALADA